MRFLPSCALALVLFGCSSGGIVTFAPDGEVSDAASSDTSATVDTGRPDTRPPASDTNVAPPDAIIVEDTPPGGCNSLANSATMVTSKNVSGSAPPAAGGTIYAGLYRLTDVTYYTNGGSELPSISMRLTLQIGSGIIQSVAESMSKTDRGTSTYTSSGSTMQMTETCPGSEVASLRYSATTSTIYMYFDLMESGFTGTLRYTLNK